MEVKVSIIIPVYNVEKYLPKCLDSCINQTLKEIEIICVNDESPDNSGKILDEYAQKDNRIVVLNQKNSGQGSARNLGLEIAKGKYIQFLDSDDSFDPSCCETMFTLMENDPEIDVACFNTNIVYEAFEEKKESDESYFKMNHKGKIKVTPDTVHQDITCNCWDKIFRKSFIDKHHLRFPEKLHFEDVAFFWFWQSRAEYIYFCHEKLINYLRREGSFLGELYKKSSQKVFDAFTVNELIYKDLLKNNQWENYKNVFIKSYLKRLEWLIEYIPCDCWSDKKKLVNSCAQFLNQFNIEDFSLTETEKDCFQSLVNKNYYVFNAYNNLGLDNATPIFKNSINIVFSVDKNYVSYLSVALQSLIDNTSKENNYDIIILYDGITGFQKRFLLNQVQGKDNISIRFLNMKKYIQHFNINNLFTRSDMSVSAYYRLFVGNIFSKFDKIIYLDCDLIVNDDIAKLFKIDLNNFAIGACLDTNIANYMIFNENNKKRMADFRDYMQQTFDYHDFKNYFNSGVLVIDIQKFNETTLDYLLELAKKNNRFYHDQNVLNVAFNNNYMQLPNIWNVQAHIKYYPRYRYELPVETISIYDDYDKHPSIIHFTSSPKVWFDPSRLWADLWWKYAAKSPFYPIILGKYIKSITKPNSSAKPKKTNPNSSDIRNCTSKPILKFKYIKYKILSKITTGQKRKHYKMKREQVKLRIKEINRYLRGMNS